MRDLYALDPEATYVVYLPLKTEPKTVESMRDAWESQTKAKVVFIVGAELLKLREEGEQA